MKHERTILVLIVTAIVCATALAPADPKDKSGTVSRERQLLLQRRLRKAMARTLVSSLEHNRRRWQSLSPDQRKKIRDEVWASFKKKSAAEQKKLLDRHEKFSNLPKEKRETYRSRAKLLAEIMAGLSEEDREALKALPPDEFAKKILALRKKQQEQLKKKAATTQPAVEPKPGDKPAATEATKARKPVATTQPATE